MPIMRTVLSFPASVFLRHKIWSELTKTDGDGVIPSASDSRLVHYKIRTKRHDGWNERSALAKTNTIKFPINFPHLHSTIFFECSMWPLQERLAAVNFLYHDSIYFLYLCTHFVECRSRNRTSLKFCLLEKSRWLEWTERFNENQHQ